MVGLRKHSGMPNFKLLASAVAQTLKGNPKILGAPLAHGHVHFSSVWDFMMSLDKPKLCTKIEVASFSHCVNIEGEHPNFWKLP